VKTSLDVLSGGSDASDVQVPGPSAAGLSGFEHVLVVSATLLGVFNEELVVRGYLQSRFQLVLGSPSKALMLSSLLFASCHVHLGVSGVLWAFVFGLTLGLAFLAIGRLWPLVVAHAIQNLVATYAP